jgi:hypothetical protein
LHREREREGGERGKGKREKEREGEIYRKGALKQRERGVKVNSR